ncbi:hypothetical protein MPTK2_2g21225 [Marchantia polymorpha subsp. ruderalis]
MQSTQRKEPEVIGNCNTLEVLDVRQICGRDRLRMTEMAFRGFMSSTNLREIIFYPIVWSSDEEIESLCLQLGGILYSSSVTRLRIGECGLSARCWLNLASGLRGNSKSKLEFLHLSNAWEDSSAVKHVADMINSAPRLQWLDLYSGLEMDDEAVGMLSQALIQSSSLECLNLDGVKWGAALFLKALAGDDGNRSIESLSLSLSLNGIDPLDGLGDCLRQLLTSNPSLKEVGLKCLRMRPEEWQQLGEVIRDNAIATHIHPEFRWEEDEEDEWKSIEALACAASSDVKDPIVYLDLTLPSYHDYVLSLNLLGRVLRGELKSLYFLSIKLGNYSPGKNKYLPPSNEDRLNGNTRETSVLKALLVEVENKDVWKYLLLCLRGNTSLTHLELSGFELDKESLRDLMGLLRGNTSLTHLDLCDLMYELDEESFRDLMGLLQVNLTLQDIYVDKITDGQEAQIEEALKQNQKRAEYMSAFREAKLEFEAAKAGRLFLCGSPLAGKTKVCQTLMRIVKGKSWIGSKVKELWRTQGIEVEFLQNNDKKQISIWDLAGQEIFRTLQNVLFPQTSNFCFFLFVYSPFCQLKSLVKPYSCFQIELEEWLSFITSSTRVTGHNRPQVLVVISHKDKVTYSSLNWAHSIVKELTHKFAKFVDLHPKCFYVNAGKKKQVIPLKDKIFEIFETLLSDKSPRVPQLCSRLSFLLSTEIKEIRSWPLWSSRKLLSGKSPEVPQLCSELSSFLVTNIKENKNCPLWSSQKFHLFCELSLTQYIPSSSPFAFDHSRILKSILSYLNDVGSIVSIPNLDYIIVDPNWLTNTLLGGLVALGQDFQAQDSGSSSRMMSTHSNASKDGFVSESDFHRLIKDFQQKQPHCVDRHVLEDILINLDLCFKVEDTSQYFIPSFIPEHASTEEHKPQELAWKTRDQTSKFVGIRIQCQDGTTMSLTAAFFPCFQMFMRRKLISEMNVSKKNVTCSRHYLRLFLDGYEVYVEQGTSHKYVDVLMLRSKHKSRSEALQYAMKHIVQELMSFCASSKGCPGVALVLGVIQTRCVEMLVPSDLRGAILIEELKSNFIRRINNKLEDIPPNMLLLVKEEELLNYEHSWPPIEGHTPVIFERARDLLWESDVEGVVNEIQQKCSQHLEPFRQALISVSNDLDQPYTESENRVGNPSNSDRLYRSNFLKLDERLRSVESVVQRVDMKLGQILTFHQEFQSRLSDFMCKVDRMIEYPESLQQARTPKRPYVTNDVGVLYRISAILHAGTTIRLYLMCESVTGFHKVKDQEGLNIRLDRENLKWLRKTIEISCKLVYYAVKAGLESTLSLSQAIPDWKDLESDIVKLDSISDRDRRAVLKGGESMELKEAWLRIQQTLAPQLRHSYSAKFKLYQVKYVSLELGGHAWVCEECMHKGLSSGILSV